MNMRSKRGQGGMSMETLVGAIVVAGLLALLFVFIFDVGGIRTRFLGGFINTESKDQITKNCNAYILGNDITTSCCKVFAMEISGQTPKMLTCFSGQQDKTLSLNENLDCGDVSVKCADYVCPRGNYAVEKCNGKDIKIDGKRFYWGLVAGSTPAEYALDVIPYKQVCCSSTSVTCEGLSGKRCNSGQTCTTPIDTKGKTLIGMNAGETCCSVDCTTPVVP